MKKLLSILLAVMMVVTVLPVNALTAPLELEEHTHSEKEALSEEPAEPEEPAEQAAAVNAETNATNDDRYYLTVKSSNSSHGIIRQQYTEIDANGKPYTVVGYFGASYQSYPAFREIIFNAIPKAGYEFDGWYKNDANGELITNNREYHVNANEIYAAYTHFANFREKEDAKLYTVSFAAVPGSMLFKVALPHTVKRSDGGEYYINNGWSVTVEEGWGLTFEVNIDDTEHYYKDDTFAVVQEGVGELTADNGKYTISNITGDVKITVKGIKVKPTPVIEVAGASSIKRGEKLVVTGRVTGDDGNPVPDGKVTVSVWASKEAGYLSREITLGSDGKYSAEFATGNFESGEHTVMVNYSEGSRYEPAGNTLKVNIIGGHEHCICGIEEGKPGRKNYYECPNADVEFTEWTGGSIEYLNDKAYVYVPSGTTITLTEDFVIDGTKTLYLCIEDGAKIQSDGTHRIVVRGEGEGKTAKLVICGCGTEKGTITGASGITEGGCIALYNGKLELYGVNMGGSSNIEKGGAVYADDVNCNIKIFDAHISGCTGIKNGGAIYLGDEKLYEYSDYTYSAEMQMYGGVIENNSVTENGGGIYVPMWNQYDGKAFTMYGGTIRNNTAGGNGGGICDAKGMGVKITGIFGAEISGNSATNGGGVYYGAGQTDHHLIEKVTIADNRATGVGGGIYAHAFGVSNKNEPPQINECKINGNTANGDGGGMYIAFASKLQIIDCEIKDNKSIGSNGGGIFLAGRSSGGTEIKGTTKISGNTAKGNGGGIYITAATLAMSAGEISGNGADNGGGVYACAKANFYVNRESVIKDNTANFGSEIGVGSDSKDNANVEINDKAVVSNSSADTNSSIKVCSGARFTVNNGVVDVVGKVNAIEGKITVKGGSVKAFAPQSTAFSEQATVAEGMIAKQGADEASAQRVEIANIDWNSKFIHIAKGCVITFDANGHGTAPESITVFPGEAVTNLPTMTEDDWEFEGWYFDKECTKPFSESPVVMGDTTLYAKWTEFTGPRVTYEWIKTDDGYDCTAKQTLKGTVLNEETVHAELNEIIPAKCETDGKGRYYAYFESDWAQTQEKDVTLPAKGHDWDRVFYDWNEANGGYRVTASRHCNHCGDKQEETVTAVYTEPTPATCEEDGQGKYTATFTSDWAETQISNVTIPASGHKPTEGSHTCANCGKQLSDHTGGTATCVAKAICEICGEPYGEINANNHDWGEAAYEWTKTETGYSVTAKRTCKNDRTHAETETAAATYAVVTPATCLKEGLGRYTAQFKNTAFETQTKDAPIPATGHDWAATTYEWIETETGYNVTAKRTCKNDKTHLETETVTATYAVITPETCTTNGLGRYTAQFKADWATTQTKDAEIPAKGHDWGTIAYSWIENKAGFECAAMRICKNDRFHVEIEAAAATYAVVTPATCLKEGLGRYTAQFKNTAFETQTKDAEIPATGHDWETTTYEWIETETGYNVTAKRVCKNDKTHVETETVTATYAVITPETCTANGLGRYTAQFKADWATTQTKDAEIPAKGHDWGTIAYSWIENKAGFECSAIRICKNDKAHAETETATVTYAVVTPATCLKEGLGRYTAQFKNTAFETQTKDAEIPATGHDWETTTYEWTKTETGYNVTAKRTCKNDKAHVETETVTATYAVITPETCTANGLGRYTAQFKADWASTQTKDAEIPAKGHDHSGHWRYNEFEHWRICPVCKDIIDVWAHDLTDWKTVLDGHGKDTNREERHCRVCAYEQYSTTIHIGGSGKNEAAETNPNTGAEVFIRHARAAAADNRVNAMA